MRFGYKEFLNTFKSELIGFTIFTLSNFSLNLLLIFSSVNDHVIVSRYPFEATDLWAKWKCFWKKLSVGLVRFFSGSMDLIFSNPIILITSSTRSISPKISGLQLGTLILRNFPFDLIIKPSYGEGSGWMDYALSPLDGR